MDIVIPPTVLTSLGTSDAPKAPTAESKPAPKAEVKPVETPKAKPEAKEAPENLTPAQKKVWKLKADGEEFEFDASDEEAIKREISKARGANKRFEDAAKLRKQAETFFEMLKNPQTLKQVLTDPKVGVDLKKFAEEYVWDQMQEESLTPEQKRQRDIERELQKYKDADSKQKADQEAQEKQALETHYETNYSQKFMDALKLGGVPQNKDTVRRMANYARTALANNLDVEPADLVRQVRKDLQDEHKAMYSTADETSLLDILGEDLAAKLRKADVKRLKSTQPEQYRKPAPSNRKPDRDKAPKRKTMDEFKEELQAKLSGR